MDFGNSPRAKLAEDFMEKISKIVHLETAKYNKIYKLKHFISEVEKEIDNNNDVQKPFDDYIDNYRTNAGRKIIKDTFGVITVLDILGFQLENFFVKKPKFSQNETDKIFNTITAYGCREMTETRFYQAINEAIELFELYQKQSRA